MQEIVHAFIPQLHQRVGFHIGVPETEALEEQLIWETKTHTRSGYGVEGNSRIVHILTLYKELQAFDDAIIIVADSNMCVIIWLHQVKLLDAGIHRATTIRDP